LNESLNGFQTPSVTESQRESCSSHKTDGEKVSKKNFAKGKVFINLPAEIKILRKVLCRAFFQESEEGYEKNKDGTCQYDNDRK